MRFSIIILNSFTFKHTDLSSIPVRGIESVDTQSLLKFLTQPTVMPHSGQGPQHVHARLFVQTVELIVWGQRHR
jgi:hypothetical protein